MSVARDNGSQPPTPILEPVTTLARPFASLWTRELRLSFITYSNNVAARVLVQQETQAGRQVARESGVERESRARVESVRGRERGT